MKILIPYLDNRDCFNAYESINVRGAEILPMLILISALILEKYVHENNLNIEILKLIS